MNLGERVKKLRIAKSWTQTDLADRCGISLGTIQRIESNVVKPSLFSLKKLGETLETDFSDSLTEFTETDSQTSNSVKKMNTFLAPFASFLKRNSILVIALVAIISAYFTWNQKKRTFLPAFDSFTVSLETINCGLETECDISLTKSDKSGKILWQKTYGGTSYDKAGQVIKTPDQGYLIVGSTSSFGRGNYDVLLIKVTTDGEVEWQQTYGSFFNEYGYFVSAFSSGDGFEIEGTQQTCGTPNVSNDCKDSLWKFQVDSEGQMIG